MKKRNWPRLILRIGAVAMALAIPALIAGWYLFFRQVDQPEWITSDPEMNFLYGSIGAEAEAGLPYWIVVVLPRIFGDQYLPGPGGYASLGLPWEEGREFPAGFSKKTVGFERVGFNCALCHAASYRLERTDSPTIVAAGGGHTSDIQGLMEFFSKSASDPRFNAETILTEIDLATRLSMVERMIYKLAIPIVRDQLAQQGEDFAWADDLPRWGPGRDAPMNLTKFNFLKIPVDGTVDNTDFPAIWSLKSRVQPDRVWPTDDFSVEGDFASTGIAPDRLMLMNLSGDTTSYRAVLIDSALGLRAQNTPFFHERMRDLEDWLMNVPPPAYPLPIDQRLAAVGANVFEAHCAECHANGRDNRLGTIIPHEEIGTDPNRSDAWTNEAAVGANEKVKEFGIERTPMVKAPIKGYIAMQLDGIWLRGPYLHNGAVPTLRALLEPPACRPAGFYRGYDVVDREHGGFVGTRCDAGPVTVAEGCAVTMTTERCMLEGEGWWLDTRERGNGNGGHVFGTTLPDEEKTALVEYLKTL